MIVNDITPSLLSKIEIDFNNNVQENKKIKQLLELLNENKATYKEANEYAIEIGTALADSFRKHISSDVLPEGRMFFNIGDRILSKTLSNNYDLVTNFTKEVQDEVNRQIGVGLKAIIPKLRTNKIKGLVDRLDSELDFEDVAWILQEPVINFTHQAVNEVLEHNVKFQVNSGLTPTIRRTLVGGACDWCVNLAGTYEYPNDVPSDIYKRHERCRCTTEYIPTKGAKQNVWTKALF